MANFNFKLWLEESNANPETILGWKVYFDYSACSSCTMPKYADPQIGEISETPSIKEDYNIIRKILLGLKNIGINKQDKIPITIHYTEEGNEIFSSSFKDKPAVYVKRPIKANKEKLLQAIPYEIGHLVFNMLHPEDKIYVRELSISYPHLNNNYEFTQDDSKQWENGNEWFANVIAKLAQGKLQGEPIRNELILLVGGKNINHHRNSGQSLSAHP